MFRSVFCRFEFARVNKICAASVIQPIKVYIQCVKYIASLYYNASSAKCARKISIDFHVNDLSICVIDQNCLFYSYANNNIHTQTAVYDYTNKLYENWPEANRHS